MVDHRRNRRHSPTRAGIPICRKCGKVGVLDPCRDCANPAQLAEYPPDPTKEQQMSRIDDREHARSDLNPDAWHDRDEQLAPDEIESLEQHEAQDKAFDLEDDETPPAAIRRMMRPTSSGLPREDER
jgi:hypothetical protein